MNEYIKPNMTLPISLHDARVTKVIINDRRDIMIHRIVFEFENGFFKVDEKEVYQTGKSYLEISRMDEDFSHIYYYEDDNREEIDFNRFAKDVEGNSFEIIDETYGYNRTKFSGSLILSDKWIDVEIEIYHFNKSIYRWGNGDNND